MVEISKISEKCFAEIYSGCLILCDTQPECNPQCPFYKPIGCEDWIRREIGDEVWLIPPEEYKE